VATTVEGIDPIGAAVGQRGTRVSAVINELGGEKIDIIEYNDDPKKYISNALSPAKILEVKILPKNRALAVVQDDQLSLAIGKDGQNVRLAAKLTGWKIDVRSPENLNEAEWAEGAEEEASGAGVAEGDADNAESAKEDKIETKKEEVEEAKEEKKKEEKEIKKDKKEEKADKGKEALKAKKKAKKVAMRLADEDALNMDEDLAEVDGEEGVGGVEETEEVKEEKKPKKTAKKAVAKSKK
jgi:N utilization substance protein A